VPKYTSKSKPTNLETAVLSNKTEEKRPNKRVANETLQLSQLNNGVIEFREALHNERK